MTVDRKLAGCLACDLTAGRHPLPGGRIFSTPSWVVEHCIGPLRIGTLIVKPFRHCTRPWELTDDESHELGPLLRLTAHTIWNLLGPDQIYTCQWSHAGWEPGHLHFVLQPAWNCDRRRHKRPGPFMQVAMFDAKELPTANIIESFAERARETFRGLAEGATHGV